MFAERLEGLRRRLGGIEAVSLVADDGIAVDTAGRSGVEVEGLAAELVAQVRAIAEQQRALDGGGVRQLAVSTDAHTLIVGEVANRYYLLLVLPAGTEVGRARFELKRARLLFENDLA
jgi:predicted regulator of Ras-like GTPase activity (Roadblock/LC7/MglB family)